MLPSLIFAVGVLVGALGVAWAVVHFGRRYGESETKLRILGVGFVLGGICLSIYVFNIELTQRRTTLFEVMAEGSEGLQPGMDAPVRTYRFSVEHAGIEHSLLVAPALDFAVNAFGEVEIGVRLQAPGGDSLIGEFHSFPARRDHGDAGLTHVVWESRTWFFTPNDTGEHQVELILITTEMPKIHLRIEDPEKRDGERIKGY